MISTVPPAVIDTDALADRLSKGDITFISDHPDEMTKEEVQKLGTFKNCVFYPPIAFVTDEARIVKQELFISNIKAALAGSPSNKVN